tara:strand:- start:4309 stop:5244 length:936 start_codon:yes stop_codon:yes gene_type:complete
MGFFKKIGKKLKKGVKKVGRKLKRGVKKLGQNIKKHGPALLGVASMFIPGGGMLGGLLGKAGGAISQFAPKLGGLLGKAGGFLGGAGGGGGGFLSNLGSGTGLFGKEGGFLSGKFGGMLGNALGGGGAGGGGGGFGGLLSSVMGGAGAMYAPEMQYDMQGIMSQYAPAGESAAELEKYYKDLADPNSQMNVAMQDRLQQGSMDQAAMGELMAERQMGGATSGIERESIGEIYDNAPEQAHNAFSNYMMANQQMTGQGMQQGYQHNLAMGDQAANLAFANQQMGFDRKQQKADSINQVGSGLLDYGMENLFG